MNHFFFFHQVIVDECSGCFFLSLSSPHLRKCAKIMRKQFYWNAYIHLFYWQSKVDSFFFFFPPCWYDGLSCVMLYPEPVQFYDRFRYYNDALYVWMLNIDRIDMHVYSYLWEFIFIMQLYSVCFYLNSNKHVSDGKASTTIERISRKCGRCDLLSRYCWVRRPSILNENYNKTSMFMNKQKFIVMGGRIRSIQYPSQSFSFIPQFSFCFLSS